MTIKVIAQLLGTHRLHLVGPPREGNFANITSENIIAYGPTQGC
jgi:hypothetical protein